MILQKINTIDTENKYDIQIQIKEELNKLYAANYLKEELSQ